MYGKYCLGVSVGRYDMNDLLKEFKRNSIPEPSKDALGMGAILYWQNIPHDPKIHINHHVKDDIDESVEVTEDLGDSTMGGVNFYKERAEPYQGLPDETIIGCYRDGVKIAEIWQEREDPKNPKKVTGYTVYPSWQHGKGALQRSWNKSFGGGEFDNPRYPSLNAAWAVRYPSLNAAFAAARKFVIGMKAESVEVTEATQLLNEGVEFRVQRTPPYEGLPDEKIIACYRDGVKIAEIWQEREDNKNPKKITGFTVYPPWVSGGGATGQGKWSKSFKTAAEAKRFVIGMKTEEVEFMENAAPLVEGLDAHLYVRGQEVYWGHTTHNHAQIAKAVDPSLYKALWDSAGMPVTRLAPLLKTAIKELETNGDKYRKLNSTESGAMLIYLDTKNPWGSVDHFLIFLKGLYAACIQNPRAHYRAYS